MYSQYSHITLSFCFRKTLWVVELNLALQRADIFRSLYYSVFPSWECFDCSGFSVHSDTVILSYCGYSITLIWSPKSWGKLQHNRNYVSIRTKIPTCTSCNSFLCNHDPHRVQHASVWFFIIIVSIFSDVIVGISSNEEHGTRLCRLSSTTMVIQVNLVQVHLV